MTKIHKDDPSSPVWRRIKAQIMSDIEAMRTQLEASTDHAKVLRTQGRIAAMRELIRKVEETPAQNGKASIFPEYKEESRHGSLY